MPLITRSASHAGSWYPSSGQTLTRDLERWLQEAHPNEDTGDDWKAVSMPVPMKDCRAVIAPHAGYAYSGRAAAWAYKMIDPSEIKRVFILGPSHHVYLDGCAVSKCASYETPIGNLPVDTAINKQLEDTGMFERMSTPTDEDEHSIELHLPYVRQVFKNQEITIVPILVGAINAEQELEYGAVLAPYLADRHNFFVISSDFCHWGKRFSYTYYHDPDSGASPGRLNSASSPTYPIHQSIQNLDKDAMDAISLDDPRAAHQAFTAYLKQTKNTICGRHPIGILLGCMTELQDTHKDQNLRFVRYEQSSQCLTDRDSSVSYASAFLTIGD